MKQEFYKGVVIVKTRLGVTIFDSMGCIGGVEVCPRPMSLKKDYSAYRYGESYEVDERLLKPGQPVTPLGNGRARTADRVAIGRTRDKLHDAVDDLLAWMQAQGPYNPNDFDRSGKFVGKIKPGPV